MIDDSSWLILDKAILRRLPLHGTEAKPDDYVDQAEGFIYRIQELPDTAKRPATVDVISSDPFVRPEYESWTPEGATYRVGGTSRIRVRGARVPGMAREHDNLAFISSRSPSFRVPTPLYHCEARGKYVIFFDFVGTPLDQVRLNSSSLRKLINQILEAAAEMAQ